MRKVIFTCQSWIIVSAANLFKWRGTVCLCVCHIIISTGYCHLANKILAVWQPTRVTTIPGLPYCRNRHETEETASHAVGNEHGYTRWTPEELCEKRIVAFKPAGLTTRQICECGKNLLYQRSKEFHYSPTEVGQVSALEEIIIGHG